MPKHEAVSMGQYGTEVQGLKDSRSQVLGCSAACINMSICQLMGGLQPAKQQLSSGRPSHTSFRHSISHACPQSSTFMKLCSSDQWSKAGAAGSRLADLSLAVGSCLLYILPCRHCLRSWTACIRRQTTCTAGSGLQRQVLGMNSDEDYGHTDQDSGVLQPSQGSSHAHCHCCPLKRPCAEAAARDEEDGASDEEQTARKASHKRASTSAANSPAQAEQQSLSDRKRANVQAMLSGRCVCSQRCPQLPSWCMT